jgi:hypothetical protein
MFIVIVEDSSPNYPKLYIEDVDTDKGVYVDISERDAADILEEFGSKVERSKE